MKKADAIASFGSVAALAAEIGVSVQAIYQWPDDVPELRGYQIRAKLAERARAADAEPATLQEAANA